MPSTEYRLWDEVQKEFVYFDLKRLVGHWSEIIFDPEEPSTQEGNRDGIAHLLKNAPLMQCTGAKDKNDKRVYEKDILRCPSNNHVGYFDYVVDDFDRFIYDRLECMVIPEEGEVIGNTCENSERLGSGKDG